MEMIKALGSCNFLMAGSSMHGYIDVVLSSVGRWTRNSLVTTEAYNCKGTGLRGVTNEK